MTLFTFFWISVREKDQKKKKGLIICFFFLNKLVLFYNELIILGHYFRGLKFLWKQDLGLI
jgi:hypothetical protein